MSDTPLARARAMLLKGRDAFGKLSRPARVLALSTLAAAVVIVAYLGYEENHVTYAPLFTRLDSEDAAAVVAKIKEQKVPYRLSEQGGATTIEIPEPKVHETRLELASAGLPHGGGVGFESFDKMHLGATEFEQRVLYRRALEGELARTIGAIAAVETARVHLVLPEKSVFVSRTDPASGTILVKLRQGHTLSPGEVGAMVHLMAASVPGLQPEHVALVTTDGLMLHKPRKTEDGAGGDDGEEGAERQAYESLVAERVRSMLERVVGPGHADVRVAAEIDSSRVERTEDHYDPSRSVLRSVDETFERTGGDTSLTGVPGAESNLPQAASSGTTTPAPNVTRESHTRNFEIDHVTEKRVQKGGSLKRMTIAVVVNDPLGPNHTVVPRSADEISRLSSLVASAAGTDAKRGDVVTVTSTTFFDEAETLNTPAPPPPAMPRLPPKAWLLAGGALGLLVLVGAGVALARRRKRGADEAPKLLEGTLTAPALEAAPEPVDVRSEALALAAQDPATAALVLRAWLGGDQAQVSHADGS